MIQKAKTRVWTRLVASLTQNGAVAGESRLGTAIDRVCGVRSGGFDILLTHRIELCSRVYYTEGDKTDARDGSRAYCTMLK